MKRLLELTCVSEYFLRNWWYKPSLVESKAEFAFASDLKYLFVANFMSLNA